MARTYGLIGTRPDLGAPLADAHLASLGSSNAPPNSPAAEHSKSGLLGKPLTSTWGIGYFDQDETLLLRRRGQDGGPTLIGDGALRRTHGLLAHECDGRLGPNRTEDTPPLRYGRMLFCCQGVSESVKPLVQVAREQLPDFLRPVVRGETFSELALALLLSELPSTGLALRLGERRSIEFELVESILTEAFRRTLRRIDALTRETGAAKFTGDLWLHTGEQLVVAHREGPLALQVIRGRADLERWDVTPVDGASGLDQAIFVALVGGQELSPVWERLPHNLLITATRGRPPETQSLLQ